jgi:hypothetical protein
MRVGLILAAIFFVLSSSATILAFTSNSGDSTPKDPAVSNEAPVDSNTNPADASVQDAPAAPDDNGCTTQNESGPGYNRSTVTCKQEVTSSPQSSSGATEPPSMPVMPAMPQVTDPSQPTRPDQADPQPGTPAEPQAQAAPQSTNPGDNDPACVTDHESGDGWERTTVRCNRQSVTAGSSATSSSVMTSSSSVSVSSSNTDGTP